MSCLNRRRLPVAMGLQRVRGERKKETNSERRDLTLLAAVAEVHAYVSLHLPGLLCLQQASVGGDLLLQPGLDVHQHLKVVALLFNAGAHVSQVLLEHVDCVLEASKHGTVPGLCLS